MQAGRDTSEWAYDRADVRRVIKHARAPLAESTPGDSAASFLAHSYAARFNLPSEVGRCAADKTVQLTAKTTGEASVSVKRVVFDDSQTGISIALARKENAALNDRTRWRELTGRSPAEPYREFRLFENMNALPRAWIVQRAKIVYEGDQLKLIRGETTSQGERDFDPKITALLDQATAAKVDSDLIRDASPPAIASVKILERAGSRMALESEALKPSILVLSEIDHPGWSATIDGNPAEILRVNYNLRGLALPSGRHRIEMKYAPASIKIGAIISSCTVIALLLAGLTVRMKARNGRQIFI